MVYVKTKKQQMKDRANRMPRHEGDGETRVRDWSMTTLNERDIAKEKTNDRLYFQRKWLKEEEEEE